MRKLLLTTTAALALAAAVFAAWNYTGSGHRAEAATKPINCTVTLDPSTTPPTETVTCVGHIVIITPFGTKTIDFTLIVDAIDNPPLGPSFGDQITSCSIDLGTGPKPIHIGPCP